MTDHENPYSILNHNPESVNRILNTRRAASEVSGLKAVNLATLQQAQELMQQPQKSGASNEQASFEERRQRANLLKERFPTLMGVAKSIIDNKIKGGSSLKFDDVAPPLARFISGDHIKILQIGNDGKIDNIIYVSEDAPESFKAPIDGEDELEIQPGAVAFYRTVDTDLPSYHNPKNPVVYNNEVEFAQSYFDKDEGTRTFQELKRELASL